MGRPEFLPSHGEGILFLDELNAAPGMVQAAFYQLVWIASSASTRCRTAGSSLLPETGNPIVPRRHACPRLCGIASFISI